MNNVNCAILSHHQLQYSMYEFSSIIFGVDVYQLCYNTGQPICFLSENAHAYMVELIPENENLDCVCTFTCIGL